MSSFGIIPLSLYVHMPWCIRKCEYCDFNSHVMRKGVPETAYIDALLRDLDCARREVDQRQICSIFIGGGTPSLMSGTAVAALLSEIRSRLDVAPAAEVTLESNPGAAEAGRFVEYRQAGVNRLSIGVQSLRAEQLKLLGRIHGPEEAISAFQMARDAGFENINLDLMFGLPGDTVAGSMFDLEMALSLNPEHLSWYQLTVEPNTAFYNRPPPLPHEDITWDIQQTGVRYLVDHGYNPYEISAYSRPDAQCKHNLNYWEFGDYLGIGAGAHGKLTDVAHNRIVRRSKAKYPNKYMQLAGASAVIENEHDIVECERPVEFLMNALRLSAGVAETLFVERTGLPISYVAARIADAQLRGLLETSASIRASALGARYLNELLCLFMEGSPKHGLPEKPELQREAIID